MQFLERPRGGERAVLVHLEIQTAETREEFDEFYDLVRSAGVHPVAVIKGARRSPDAKFFAGAGKVEEIRAQAEQHQAEVILFNHSLTPAQERNLEMQAKCRVLDRTGLILDIFAQRATTFEGKLQVELAQLRHLSTRLVRGWTHLERQKGGIGLRGPGETQLETDRRLIKNRIYQLNKRLDKVRRQRQERRRARDRTGSSTVSLVGYTNAGKSTLFNRLTGSEVFAADQLFATLDPTLRRIALRDCGPVILADTVGFIRHLPHSLVAAFRSTLEESRVASLLLHVIDAREDERHERVSQVNRVLQEIDADGVPQIEVYNKIDLLENHAPRIDRDAEGRAQRVWVSAASGAGLDLLREAVAERLHELASYAGEASTGAMRIRRRLHLGAAAGKLRAQLYARGVVVAEVPTETGGWMLDVDVWQDEWAEFMPDDHRLVEEDVPLTAVNNG
ncbi:MAG: GTPase HflX [Gammaproteobacteria bacterium]